MSSIQKSNEGAGFTASCTPSTLVGSHGRHRTEVLLLEHGEGHDELLPRGDGVHRHGEVVAAVAGAGATLGHGGGRLLGDLHQDDQWLTCPRIGGAAPARPERDARVGAHVVRQPHGGGVVEVEPDPHAVAGEARPEGVHRVEAGYSGRRGSPREARASGRGRLDAAVRPVVVGEPAPRAPTLVDDVRGPLLHVVDEVGHRDGDRARATSVRPRARAARARSCGAAARRAARTRSWMRRWRLPWWTSSWSRSWSPRPRCSRWWCSPSRFRRPSPRIPPSSIGACHRRARVSADSTRPHPGTRLPREERRSWKWGNACALR